MSSAPTLRAAVDTWVDQANASTRNAGATTLQVKGSAAYAFVYFANPAPLGATITDARLRLYRTKAWTGTRTISVRAVSAAWQVSKTSWNNQPAVSGTTITVTDNGGPAGGVIELQVKSLLQLASAGAAWYGFRVQTSDAGALAFGSAEGVDANRPEFAVSWSDVPGKPTTLNPAQPVSTGKPVLRFDYTDFGGDTSLGAVRVQVDPAGNFTAPAWDSGWVNSTDPQLDLATQGATAYPGIANGASATWRVQARDGAGLASDWSDPVTFTRSDLGVVTINNPAAGASPVVWEPTPPMLWAFSGTQTKYRVRIVDPAKPSTEYATSGWTTGTDTAWTVPSDKLTGPGPYRLIVEVADNVSRVQNLNGDAYANAYRDFTVTDDPATTGVTGLAATQPTQQPSVVLTWSRATAPDAFVILRDGVTVPGADNVPPGDVLVSGTNYSYRDDTARPWVPHTWKVKAVVNTKQSSASSVTMTPTQRGIWLLDKGLGLSVWLAGTDGGTWTRGEDATVLYPLGAKRAVRRVQGLRGYEGSLSGNLVDAYGKTALQYEADLLAMRDNPTRPVTLALGDLVLKVVIGNIGTVPTPNTPPARLASFDFWEQP